MSYFPLKIVRATRDALKAKGFPVELIEIPNHDHWYYDQAVKIQSNSLGVSEEIRTRQPTIPVILSDSTSGT